MKVLIAFRNKVSEKEIQEDRFFMNIDKSMKALVTNLIILLEISLQ